MGLLSAHGPHSHSHLYPRHRPHPHPGTLTLTLTLGEMVYPWMSEDYDQLQGLGDCAEILASKRDWGPLYNLDVLQDTKVNISNF